MSHNTGIELSEANTGNRARSTFPSGTLSLVHLAVRTVRVLWQSQVGTITETTGVRATNLLDRTRSASLGEF